MNFAKGLSAQKETATSEPVEVPPKRFFYIGSAVFCALVGMWPILAGKTPRIGWLAGCGGLLLSAAFRPAFLNPVERLRRRSEVLFVAAANTIAAGFLLYGVLMPVGLLQRMLGRDALALRFNRSVPTYWIDCRVPGPSARTASLLLQVVGFLRARKKLWLLPIIILMMVFGMLLIFTQATAPSPFIYPLF